MKTSDFRKPITSSQIKENLNKQFGLHVSLEKYSREQLEDMRNKLRTRVFQQEGQAGMNDLLTNETYQKDKAMLALLNTRIKEMLGEDIKKLRDKLQQIEEAKKGVLAPKYKKHPKGTQKATKDYDGDGKVETPKDEVWGSRAKAAAKAGKSFSEASKPDFLDLDKDGDKKEPMKKASKEKKMKEGFDDMMKAVADRNKGSETGKKSVSKTGHEVDRTKPGVVKATKVAPKEKDVKEDYRDLMKPSEWKQTSLSLDAAKKKYGDSNAKIEGKNRLGEPIVVVRTGGVKEAEDKKCNHTPKGKSCPVHGLKECGTMKEAKKADKPFAVGMAAAKKEAGITKTPAKDLPKKVVKKGHEIGKSIKKAQKDESVSIFRRHVKIVNESLGYLLAEDEEEKAKAITAASDMVNDFTSWMQRVGQYQTKVMIELSDEIRHNFGYAEAEAFKQAVGPALTATLETLTSQREAISSAVATLAGEQMPTQPMGTEPAMEPEMPMEPTAPDEMNSTPDEFAASDAAAGTASTAGREMRESRFARKLAESHSIMSRLAK